MTTTTTKRLTKPVPGRLSSHRRCHRARQRPHRPLLGALKHESEGRFAAIRQVSWPAREGASGVLKRVCWCARREIAVRAGPLCEKSPVCLDAHVGLVLGSAVALWVPTHDKGLGCCHRSCYMNCNHRVWLRISSGFLASLVGSCTQSA